MNANPNAQMQLTSKMENATHVSRIVINVLDQMTALNVHPPRKNNGALLLINLNANLNAMINSDIRKLIKFANLVLMKLARNAIINLKNVLIAQMEISYKMELAYPIADRIIILKEMNAYLVWKFARPVLVEQNALLVIPLSS